MMLPWSGTADCVKCGGGSPEAKYKEAKNHTQHEGLPERMIRTCTVCGYTWKEHPRDEDGK